MLNKLKVDGIFSEGYGIIPKKLMKMQLDNKIGKKQKGKNVKLILVYMLSYTGKESECFVSIETIAKDLELSKPTVIEAIKNACKLGYLEKKQIYPDEPMRHDLKYVLNI